MTATPAIALWSILAADEGVVGIVPADSITREDAKMEAVPPYIIIHDVGLESNYALSGATSLKFASLRLEIFSRSLSQIDAIVESLVTALDAYSGTLEGIGVQGIFLENQFGDSDIEHIGGEARLYRKFQDWRMAYSVE